MPKLYLSRHGRTVEFGRVPGGYSMWSAVLSGSVWSLYLGGSLWYSGSILGCARLVRSSVSPDHWLV